MKRALDSGLPPSPTPNNANNADEPDPVRGNTSDHDNNLHGEDDAHTRSPRMHSPAADQFPATNPLYAFDVDEPLPDWDQLMQMMPHSPPQLNQQQAQAPATPSTDNDESSEADQSDQELSLDNSSSDSTHGTEPRLSEFDRKIKPKILASIKTAANELSINSYDKKELTELLQICKDYPTITNLYLRRDLDHRPIDAPEIRSILTEFFCNHYGIQALATPGLSKKGIRCSAQLLCAILNNRSLRILDLSFLDLIAPNQQESEAITESIRKNSNLQTLKLGYIANLKTIDFIVSALSNNSTLSELHIGHEMPIGTGRILAKLTRSNTHLKCLKYSLSGEPAFHDITVAIAALSENHTLETLGLKHPAGTDELPKELVDPLLKNTNLKTLEITGFERFAPKAMATLMKVIGTHLNLINVGCLPVPIDPLGFKAFVERLKASYNPRLQSISISWEELTDMRYFDIDNPAHTQYVSDVLNALEAFPNLSSLVLDDFPEVDYLFNFLQYRPRINNISLPSAELRDERLQEKLLALVRGYSHIKEFDLWHRADGTIPFEDIKFRNKLGSELQLNEIVSIDPNLDLWTDVMHAVLLAYSQKNPDMPIMNRDVVSELVKAIVRHLPAKQARAILNDLQDQAEKIQSAITM
ncbi:MAG: hypothetical protein ACKO5Z_01245 [Burkholderiaceae bacterium]